MICNTSQEACGSGGFFGGLAAAPAIAVIGVGFGVMQIIGGDYLDNNFSYTLFTPHRP
jgi:hypothetical protein